MQEQLQKAKDALAIAPGGNAAATVAALGTSPTVWAVTGGPTECIGPVPMFFSRLSKAIDRACLSSAWGPGGSLA
jgi:hypothetical protein